MSKELEAKVTALTSENTSLKTTAAQQEKEIASLKDVALKYEEEIVALRDKLEHSAKTGKAPSIPIKGTLEVSWEKPDGTKISKTVKFVDGRKFTPLKDGRKVPSEALMLIANGKKPSKDHLVQYNFLDTITQQAAVERITWLTQIGSTSVVEVK